MSEASYITELTSYSFVDVTGDDAAKFLQGQLSINTATPTYENACLATLCNPKGRIVSLFHIAQTTGGFRLFMPKDTILACINHLKKYGVFYKIEINQMNQQRVLGIISESNIELTHKNSTLPETNIYSTVSRMLLVSLPMDKPITELAQEFSLQVTSEENSWYWELAQNRICWLTEQSVEQFLPHNLNLPALSAVDFKKGCFTGQEVIARMQYKGKLKQHLQLLKSQSDTDILPGTKLIQDEKNVAEVICATHRRGKGSLVLAIMKDSANKQQIFTSAAKNSPILDLVL